ncbi:MAG: hypothetical protein KME42_00285 [Tildeniella nuda ZEHNDER 1965/U140]|jgi:hypothetical protein|nr:hypothetical protein [Tildeniella nuda ZEHNDER 1965/U140]
MPTLDRLQTKLDDLQGEYDLLSKKLRSLRQARRLETDVAVKLKLDVQIAETTEELEQVEQDLDRLECQIKEVAEPASISPSVNLDQLHGALLKLGYWEQQRSFKKVIKDHPVGAFLIQGTSPEYGQRWLLNRLALETSRSLEAKVVKVNLGRVSSRTDIPALWRELSGRVGLGRQSTPTEIVEKVHQWWQTQNVLVVFYDVHGTIEDNLRDLITDFWAVLANRVSETATQGNGFKLLMFLLDDKGSVNTWNLTFAKQYDSTWKPIIPFGLPNLTEFSSDLLITWIEQQSDVLPTAITDDAETMVETLLANTDNGLPEPTLREICDLCGCNWYDQEDRWLKL